MAKRIIYLHGFASSPGSYKAQLFIKALRERGHDPLLPDLNEGEGGFTRLTISRMVDQVAQLSQDVGPGELILIGSSMGGYVAARYASQSDRPAALVLMCPAFGFLKRWVDRLTDAERNQWKEDGTTEVMHFATNEMTPLAWGMMADGETHPEAPHVEVPTLIFHGRDDEVVDPAGSVAYAESHPNVELQMMDSDHGMGDVVEQIIEQSLTFLEPHL